MDKRIVVLIAVVLVGAAAYMGYDYYSTKSAHAAAISYICSGSDIKIVAEELAKLRSGAQSKSLEAIVAQGQQMASRIKPIQDSAHNDAFLRAHASYFGKVARGDKTQRSEVLVSLAQDAKKQCPQKAADIYATAETLGVVIGAFK